MEKGMNKGKILGRAGKRKGRVREWKKKREGYEKGKKKRDG